MLIYNLLTICFLFLLTGHNLLVAASTATVTVTYTIGSIDSFSLSGNPAPLVVATATPGQEPTNCTHSSCTYAITTNNSDRRITGALTSAMPLGVSLLVELGAPTGATSAGAVSLTTTAQDLVTGISNITEGGLAKSYTLVCTVDAAQVTAATNTITYTIGP